MAKQMCLGSGPVCATCLPYEWNIGMSLEIRKWTLDRLFTCKIATSKWTLYPGSRFRGKLMEYKEQRLFNLGQHGVTHISMRFCVIMEIKPDTRVTQNVTFMQSCGCGSTVENKT